MDKQILILLGIVFVIVFFAWLDRRMHPGRRDTIVRITPLKDEDPLTLDRIFIDRMNAGYVGPLEDEDY